MGGVVIPELYLLPYQIYPADLNMAIDEVLITLPGTFLRFYGWERPTLSFGKSTTNRRGINVESCRNGQLDVVKRKTGGKTVLHQFELTYSFVSDSELFSRSILETYRLVSQPIAHCFAEMGLIAEMKNKEAGQDDTTICFNEVSAYELTIAGKKVVGSAQYRRRDRFLQHGSILLEIDWDLWKAVWDIPDDSTLLEDRVTCLGKHFAKNIPTENLANKLQLSFARIFQAKIIETVLDQTALRKAAELRTNYRWDDFWLD